MPNLTREQWDTLTPKQQWDIKVALRGPDCGGSEVIKEFTTAVIRSHVSEVMRVGGQTNPYLGCVVLPYKSSFVSQELATKLKELGVPSILFWNGHHFFEHIEEAAHHLGIPIIKVDKEIWLKAMSTSGYGATPAKSLLASLKESKTDSCGLSTAKPIKLMATYIKRLNGEIPMNEESEDT